MKRRRFLQALATAPATGLIAQQPAPPPPQAAPAVATATAVSAEYPKLDLSVADAASDTVRHFFTASQFAALEKLGGILMPASGSGPGAIETRAPEFLDFLLSESAPERQQVYRTGLDGLNTQARRRFTKPFADLDADQAAELLAPLRVPWTYQPPADPVARFLLAAKLDIRAATMNSLEWNAAANSDGRRGPSGLYWYPID
jgi:Gluconate 2-dehydrogenase subunit 3